MAYHEREYPSAMAVGDQDVTLAFAHSLARCKARPSRISARFSALFIGFYFRLLTDFYFCVGMEALRGIEAARKQETFRFLMGEATQFRAQTGVEAPLDYNFRSAQVYKSMGVVDQQHRTYTGRQRQQRQQRFDANQRPPPPPPNYPPPEVAGNGSRGGRGRGGHHPTMGYRHPEGSQ
ncbi:hypothetical protein BDR26DRAFT_870024 [Obelidium mucronatum]|nr:hypothetical protein BDR26DRAFT_870024 [Obelidium mucronatum]